MVLDGVEYVLIPKDVFDKTLGITKEVEDVVPNTAGLNDFEVESKSPVVSAQPQKESIKVVEVMPDVKKAEAKVYGYAERLKKHALVPEDVMVLKTNFEDMPELPEIARNDYTDASKIKGKWGFYGPGAERDLG